VTEIEDRKSPAAIPQHLRDRLHNAQQDHLASFDHLRVAVCGYVDDLRERGVSYDDTLIAVRNLVGQLDGKTPYSAASDKHNGQIVESMLLWCKEHWKH
jgi:hypothetical protein